MDTGSLAELTKRLMGLASNRRGLAVGLVGAPGIGKSFGARQVLTKLPYRSLSLNLCTPSTVMAALPRASRLPEWAERALGRNLEPERLGDALAAWLGSLAPFVLHLEDLHEATPDELALWRRVAGQVRQGCGTGLLVTSRQALPEPFETLWLAAKTRQEIAALLEEKVAMSLPVAALDWIQRQACGNALFALEYLAYLSRMGNLYSDGSRWRWRPPDQNSLPGSVEAVIAQVLHGHQFSNQATKALEVWAVLGENLETTLWAAIANLTPQGLNEALGELEAAGVVHEGRWAHPLYAQVARGHLSRGTRQSVARRALELYGDHPQSAPWVADANLERQEARTILLVHAARLAASDPIAAAKLIAHAADHADGAERLALALRAAEALEEGSPNEALRLAERAWTLAPDDPRSSILFARLLGVTGRFEPAEDLLNTLDPAVAQPALIDLFVQARDFARAASLFEAAPNTFATRIVTRVNAALMHLGQFERAEGLIRQSLERSNLEPSETAALLGNLADLYTVRGELKKAADFQRQGIALLRDTNQAHELARLIASHAEVLEMLAEFGAAKRALEEATQRYIALGDGRGHAWMRSRLGALLADTGPFIDAEEALLSSLEDLERFGDRPHLATAHINLAYLYLNWSPISGTMLAHRHASEALRWAQVCGSAVVEAQAAAILAWAEAARGQPERARTSAQAGLELSERIGYPFSTTLCRFALGLASATTNRTVAIEQMLAAVSILHGLGLPAVAERLGLEADHLAGDLKSARTRLAYFESHELHGLIMVAQRLFPSLNDAQSAALPEAKFAFRLEVLGSIRLLRNTQPVRLGALAGSLLAYLLFARLAGREDVPLPELLEVLYPERPEPESRNALHQLVHRLRGALESDVLIRTQTGYTIQALGSDAEDFMATGSLPLWRGALLNGQWFFGDPITRARLYDRVYAAVASSFKTDPHEAARAGLILIEAQPYDLETLSLTLNALREAGEAAVFDHIYLEAKIRFAEVGETLPDDVETFLLKDNSKKNITVEN